MREDSYDIRSFNFAQLSDFVEQVADSSPQDLLVFKNYIDQAITQEFFTDKDLQYSLGKFINLMQVLALNGQKVEGAAFFKFLTMVKNHISINNKDSIKHIEVKNRLINLVWTLIYRENEIMQGSAVRRQQYE